MPSGRVFAIRMDKPAESDRIADRLEARSITTKRSINSLVLQAIREFLAREDGQESTPEDLTRLLRSTTDWLGSTSHTLNVVRERITVLENLADHFNQSLCVDSDRLNAIVIALLGVIEETHPDWTKEQLNGLKSVLSPSHPKLAPSLFKGRGPLGDEAGRGEGNDSGLSR